MGIAVGVALGVGVSVGVTPGVVVSVGDGDGVGDGVAVTVGDSVGEDVAVVGMGFAVFAAAWVGETVPLLRATSAKSSRTNTRTSAKHGVVR